MNTYLRRYADGSVGAYNAESTYKPKEDDCKTYIVDFEAGTVTEVTPKNGWHVVHEDGESEPRNCFYVNDRAVGCVQKNLLVHKSPCNLFVYIYNPLVHFWTTDLTETQAKQIVEKFA